MENPETQIKSRSDVLPATVSSDTPEGHLDQGHLSGLQAGGLAIATFGPGVGIVTVPAFTWMVAGSGSWLSVLLAVLGTSLVGISIVLFARRSVGTGSLYSYIGESFKPWARVVTASGVVVGYVFAVAGLLAGTGTYLVSFLVSEGVVGDAGDGVYIATYVISAAIAAMFAIRGLDASVRVSVSLALISVPVAVVVLVGAIRNTGIDLTSQLSLSGSSFGGVTQGVATAAAFLVMFESSAALAAETRSPRKTIPRVVMAVPIGLGTIFALATVVQYAALNALPAEALVNASPPAALARAAGFDFLAEVADLVVALGLFVAIVGFFNYAPRVAMTIANEGLLPRGLAAVHPRFRTPARAIGALAVVSAALPSAFLASSDESALTVNVVVTTLVTYFWVVPYLLISLAGARLVLRERRLPWLLLPAIALGAVIIVWILVAGIANTRPDVLGMSVWIAVSIYFAVTAGFYIASRRNPLFSNGEIADLRETHDA